MALSAGVRVSSRRSGSTATPPMDRTGAWLKATVHTV